MKTDTGPLCIKLVGMREEDAEVLIELFNLRHRVLTRDGQPYMKTNDARSDRINLHIRSGVVERAHVG